MRFDLCSALIVANAIIISINVIVGSDYQLTILHTNDIHSRIEQTNKYLGVCKTADQGKILIRYFNIATILFILEF